MTEDKSLLTFNAFGTVSVSREKVSATITAVAGGRSIVRSVSKEFEPIDGVGDGEISALIFGAWLDQGTRVTSHEVGRLQSGVSLTDLPEVADVLRSALDMIRRTVDFS